MGSATSVNNMETVLSIPASVLTGGRSVVNCQLGPPVSADFPRFNVAKADLSHYEELIEQLGESCLDLEDVVDSFPQGSQVRLHPRHVDERRNRDLDNENIAFYTLESLLARHSLARQKLGELGDTSQDPFSPEVMLGTLSPSKEDQHTSLGDAPTSGHPVVQDDGKLGGLGHATLGRSIVLPCGSPSPPLLHEDKLSGHGSGGPEVVWLRQEGKLALLHEAKLYGPGSGGSDVVRLRQEGKLVLQHEVKLFGHVAGGGVDVKMASPQVCQVPCDPAPPIQSDIDGLQPVGPPGIPGALPARYSSLATHTAGGCPCNHPVGTTPDYSGAQHLY